MSAAVPFHPAPPPFETLVVRERDHMLVLVEGELDIGTAGTLRREVLELAAQGCTSVVLDLSRLRFADSAQIHLLYDLEAAAARDGFRFAVQTGNATPAGRLLALTGLRARFAVA